MWKSPSEQVSNAKQLQTVINMKKEAEQIAMIENIRAFPLDGLVREKLSKMILKLSPELKDCNSLEREGGKLLGRE